MSPWERQVCLAPSTDRFVPNESEKSTRNDTCYWYFVSDAISREILRQSDVLGKLCFAAAFPHGRALVHQAFRLFPRGAAFVEEHGIVELCRRLFIERITFRVRWSESRKQFIVFSPRSTRVLPSEPPVLPLPIPPKALRYLRKKSAFEALFNTKTAAHFIIGMGNSCDFRFHQD
ncbi:unnamed protein product [Caenorhabditis sp. 36 PRJEB53466]|nr:unnamed protein product [Caenorhabditis sp. 36 PRJEB53466]